jgi:branched-chain amino acid transport system substrate-binding protein
MRYWIVFAILFFDFVTGRGAVATQKIELKVGMIFRFADKFNSSVEKIVHGIETAKALFEKENPGYTVTLIPLSQNAYGDSPTGSSPGLESAVKAAEEAIRRKLPVVIGGELSEESLVLGDVLSSRGVVLMTPTSSNPEVTKNKPFVFRACFSDDQVGDKLAEYAMEKLHVKKVGILQNTSSPYTDFLSRRFYERFTALTKDVPAQGRPEISVHKFLKRTIDFKSIVEDMKRRGITHVAAFTHDMDMLNFLRQATSLEFFPTYIASDGWGSNEYVHQVFVKESPAGASFVVYRNSYWKDDLESELADSFRLVFKAKFHANPSHWEAISFDAGWLVLNAMKRANNPSEGKAIQEALKKMNGLPLVTAASYSLGPNNTPAKELFIYRIDGRGIHFMEKTR